MSLPVALSVWLLLPGYPHSTKIWYLTENDKNLALERAAKQKKAQVTGVINFKLLRRMFSSWRWWLLCLTYIVVSAFANHETSIVGNRETELWSHIGDKKWI